MSPWAWVKAHMWWGVGLLVVVATFLYAGWSAARAKLKEANRNLADSKENARLATARAIRAEENATAHAKLRDEMKAMLEKVAADHAAALAAARTEEATARAEVAKKGSAADEFNDWASKRENP